MCTKYQNVLVKKMEGVEFLIQTKLQRTVTLKELNSEPLILITNVHLTNINVLAKFDKFPCNKRSLSKRGEGLFKILGII